MMRVGYDVERAWFTFLTKMLMHPNLVDIVNKSMPEDAGVI